MHSLVDIELRLIIRGGFSCRRHFSDDRFQIIFCLWKCQTYKRCALGVGAK